MTWGDQLNGADYNTARTYGMSVAVPPTNYRWCHHTAVIGQGNDRVASALAVQTKEELRDLRLSWLDQFDLEIREEGNYRYWRWLGERSGLRGAYVDDAGTPRQVRWSEKRSIDTPLPKTPGFWPSDE